MIDDEDRSRTLRQLKGGDAFMLYAEAGGGTSNNLASVMVYDPSTAPDGELTYDQIVDLFRERLHLGRSFRERLVRVPFDLDHPWWFESADVDLEFHIRELSLPAPGSFEQLAKQAARIHARPFDFTRPPWEVYVIHGLAPFDDDIPEGCIVLMMRVHHTAVDGMAGMELLSLTHSITPDVVPVQRPDVPPPGDPEPNMVELFSQGLVRRLNQPRRILRAVARAIPALSAAVPQIVSGDVELGSMTMPQTPLGVPIESPSRLWTVRRSNFEDWKLIRTSVPGATINDVGLAIVSGALRSHLKGRGALPEASLLAGVPISLRTEAGGTDGNEVGSMTTSLHTDIEDPVERLAAIVRSTAASKLRKQAIGANTLKQISEELPGRLIGVALSAPARLQRLSRNAPSVPLPISNVPGPPVDLYLGGARLVAMMGLGPVLHGLGLLHLITSYRGKMSISVTTSPDVMDDAEAYGDDLAASFSELLRAAKAATQA